MLIISLFITGIMNHIDILSDKLPTRTPNIQSSLYVTGM